MLRVRRPRLINVLTLLALVLGAATLALWVRTLYVVESLDYEGPTGRDCGAFTRRHGVGVAWAANVRLWQARPPPPRVAWARSARRRGEAGYEARPLLHDALGFGWEGLHGTIQSPAAPAGPVRYHYGCVTAPLWAVFVLTVVLPLSRLGRRARRGRLARAGRCAACGYDLRATPARCPECGSAAPAGRRGAISAPHRQFSGRSGV